MPKTRTSGQGRPKGSKNKRTIAQQKAAKRGLMPLEFMLALLRTEEASPDDRKWAAKEAAPYVHSRLNSTEIKVPEKIVHEVRIKIVGHDP